MTTTTLDICTILHALRSFDIARGSDCVWSGNTVEHKRLLEFYWMYRDDILQLDDIESKVSDDHMKLNAFLKKRGFPAFFEPLEGNLGVASVLDMLVNWLEAGKTTDEFGEPVEVVNGGVTYPAFKLGKKTARSFFLSGSQDPLVALSTRTGHTVWITKAERVPKDGLEVMDMVDGISHSSMYFNELSSVVIPKIDLETASDVSWLKGLHNTDASEKDGWKIVEAAQLFKLRMNEHGARVKAATTIGVYGTSLPRPPVIIDKPFLFWVTQPGHSTIPLAAAYLDVDSWVEPAGSLEEL